MDLLSGSYSRSDDPMAGLFQMLWGQEDGSFKAAEILYGNNREPLIIPYQPEARMTEGICTRPTAADWDGDGKLDLVVGNFAGTFYLFRGEGEGRFAPTPEAIQSEGKPLAISGQHGDPFVIDWDGDGDLDLLSGSSTGGVQWAKNAGGKDKLPQLKPFVTLIPGGEEGAWGASFEESKLSGPVGSTRVWADDVNGDGRLDLLVGDSVTVATPAEGISREDFAAHQAAWNKIHAENLDLASLLEGAASDENSKHFNLLREKRSELVTEETTGFVWLYLAK